MTKITYFADDSSMGDTNPEDCEKFRRAKMRYTLAEAIELADAADACEDSLNALKGFETWEQVLTHPMAFEWAEWVATTLKWGPVGFAEYSKLINSARAEYSKLIDSARAEYDKIVNPAKKEFVVSMYNWIMEDDESVTPAQAEYA